MKNTLKFNSLVMLQFKQEVTKNGMFKKVQQRSLTIKETESRRHVNVIYPNE